MAKSRTTIKIIHPAPISDPPEVPPENEGRFYNSASADGFNLIKLIYDFFVVHDSLMYATYKKYKELRINRFLDFCFAMIAYLIDTIHIIAVYAIIFILMSIIVFSLAKLVGLVDLIVSLHWIK